MYAFGLPVSHEELERRLAAHGKRYSIASATTDGVYVYKLRKHRLTLFYGMTYTERFHGILCKTQNGLKLIGTFHAKGLLFALLVFILMSINSLCFDMPFSLRPVFIIIGLSFLGIFFADKKPSPQKTRVLNFIREKLMVEQHLN